MESLLLWIIVLTVCSAIFLPYFVKFRRQQKADISRKHEAASLGADKPIAQYPLIDIVRCIGCATCVKACPEQEVLGIVFGKATVINGLKCIGHGKCAEVCPVGAIQVGLGDIKDRDDIPLMNEFNETVIPNLFIAGELGGFALIKNAIAQGTMVIDRIASQPERTTDPEIKDVIIVGAGPTGMSAALNAVKNKLSYLVLDQQGAGGTILQYPRKKIVLVQPVEIPLFGYLKKSEYSKEELLEIWLGLKEKYNLNIQVGEKVTNITQNDGYLTVESQDKLFKARNVVLALGRRGTPRKLGVPGENSAKVMYKLIDVESHQNEKILIVGGGDSAIEVAYGLAMQGTNKVTISYRKNQFFRLKKKNAERITQLIKSGQVKTIMESNIMEIQEDSVYLDVKGNKGKLSNDYVFIFAGGEPPFKLLRKMGIKFGAD
ncbi:MAG: 4Fe-4S dicluster domain-containing protein [Calditrichaeota bacterium]|nr:MAG: 4Fe-4S dicluster domain-containing protein [Calditrichota bacterium]